MAAREISPNPTSTGKWVALSLVLAAVCLMIRAPGLMALPIFGDEAIYLRWAQLVRGSEVMDSHPWISLADPKPPLHFWILAVVFRWTADPLVAARLVSVLAGILSIPLLILIGREMGFLMGEGSEKDQSRGRILGLFTAILTIFCPFLAFYQRLATADALFVCESLATVWLSLAWARLVVRDAKKSWWAAVGLGVAIGAGLMTRQGLSYTICALPAVAWILHALTEVRGRAKNARGAFEVVTTQGDVNRTTSEVKKQRLPWLASIGGIFLAAIIAAGIWAPALLAELQDRARTLRNEASGPSTAPLTRDDMLKEVKRRIFYQERFTEGDSRTAVATRNFRWTFIPARNTDGQVTSGWLPLYMTPAVFVLSLAGLAYMAVRHTRLFVFVLIWTLLMIAPLVLLANTIFSRYVLAGVPPLLFAAALALTDALGLWLERTAKKPLIATVGLCAIMAALLFSPMRELALQATRWPDQTLTAGEKGQAGDQYQYLHGWTSGTGTLKAIHYIRQLAQVGPVAVITDNGWGTPADAAWVYLSEYPQVNVYYADNPRTLRPRPRDGMFRLKDDKWLFPADRLVSLPEGIPILFITKDTAPSSGPDLPTDQVLRKDNPNLGAPLTFKGIAHNGTLQEGVMLFPIVRNPGQQP